MSGILKITRAQLKLQCLEPKENSITNGLFLPQSKDVFTQLPKFCVKLKISQARQLAVQALDQMMCLALRRLFAAIQVGVLHLQLKLRLPTTQAT